MSDPNTTTVSTKKKEKKADPDNITKRQIWKKLCYLQETLHETQEQVLDNKKKLNKIEECIKPNGGVQPSKKGLSIFKTEDKSEFTDVGRDIYQELMKEGHLTRKDLEEILIHHNMSKSKPTHLNYLRKIAGEVQAYFKNEKFGSDRKVKFKSGTQGGRNGGKPSRVTIRHH